MYLLNLNFHNHGPNSEQVTCHTKWVKQAFLNKNFILAGPKKEGTGGIIITVDMTRKELNKLIEQDPFITSGIASYSVTHFEPSFYQKELNTLTAEQI